MSDEDDEMLEVFVQEAKEHLDQLEPDLLSLEETPDDKETINRIFRSVHSVKGTSGFFGLDNISKLAHTMENLMSLVREGEVDLTSPMLDALLKGTDKLRIMVDDPGSQASVDIVPEVNEIKPFIGEGPAEIGGAPAAEAAPPPAEEPAAAPEPEATPAATSEDGIPVSLKRFKIDPAQFKEALDSSQRIYVLTLLGNEDIDSKGRAPMDFFNEIESLGKFLDSCTDASAIDGLDTAIDNELKYMFLFMAGMEPDLLAGAFDLNPERIEALDDDVVKKISELPDVIEPEPQTCELPEPVDAEPAPEPAPTPEPEPTPEPAAPPPKPAPAPIAKKPKDEVAAPKKASPAKKPSAIGKQIARKKAEETIRVPISVLDDLMTLAGEMVLGRNQLMRLASEVSDEIQGMPSVLQNINIVTTDLQEKVMQTRLQPIGTILGKFNRIIRDLGAKLNKEIELVIQGKEVELDRSILEGISDPLTHLIRNCADHAIEPPDEREASGKDRKGTVKLIARHAGGQVHVEIIDDGRGIDPEILKRKAIEKGLLTQDEADRMSDRQAQAIIFMPGFSSAEQVSDVSGRGVGMDVVRTNVEDLGGSIELDSTTGHGTRICLKLPLTLAIVPAMIIETGGHRFAVPQVNLEEVVNLDANVKIETVRGSPVLRLRNKLLPLVSLRKILGIATESGDPDDVDQNASYIMVLQSGQHQFGLIVEELLNIEEIVVKPLSRYLQTVQCYSGATILGDGTVALILDTTGIVEMAKLNFTDDGKSESTEMAQLEGAQAGESQSLILFKNAESEVFAINLAMVSRIEKVEVSKVEQIGNKEYIKYLGGSLRLLRLHDYMPVSQPEQEPKHIHVIIPNLVSSPIGIVATEVVDAIESSVALEEDGISGKGILGSAIINGHLTLFVDIYSIFEEADPEHYSYVKSSNTLAQTRILLAEDTSFFRTIVTQYMKDYCLSIETAKNGLEAWDMLNSNEYDLLLTDIEMPGLNGFELTERVRASDNLKDLPVVALTSLSSDKNRERGLEAGVDAYETKLDKDHLRETVEAVVKGEYIEQRELPGPQPTTAG